MLTRRKLAAMIARAVCGCLAVATAAAPVGAQSEVAGWDLLRRVAAANDRPSTAAERRRSPLAPDAGRVVYRVPPRDTDARITRFLRDHYIFYYRTIPQNGRLFVFLPGTWGRPASYQRVLDAAARAGYKAIGLEYPNDTLDPRASAVVQICLRNPDPECSARVRTVRVVGGSADGVVVPPADGLENRLDKLLAYLAERYPEGGWDEFLAGGQIAWDKVALGGHSQGAGMAAFLAKRHAVARVALWSGPGDYVLATHRAASWLSEPSATPPDRWYGVLHRDETGARALALAYAALRIPGSPADVELPVLPVSHQFIVTLPPRVGPRTPILPAIAGAAHGSVVTDDRTPLDATGQPAYLPVWRRMIGP